jgi:transcription elongation GreA/GreB family factor
MQRRTIIILVIVAALLVSFIYGWNEYHRESKSLHSVKAAFSSDAEQLINEFQAADATAEKKYFGKVLEVKGKIKQVEKDSDGHYTLVLGSAAGMSAVRCSMDSTINNELLNIKEGDEVTVKGNFTGYQKDETGLLGSDIQLNRAVIAKK